MQIKVSTDSCYQIIAEGIVLNIFTKTENNLEEFILYQNYPNPLNPSTVIEFSLPENVRNVKLSIYNALGERIAELVNKALVASKYQVQWKASNVATGVHIYELRTEKFVPVKKIVLLKQIKIFNQTSVRTGLQGFSLVNYKSILVDYDSNLTIGFL